MVSQSSDTQALCPPAAPKPALTPALRRLFWLLAIPAGLLAINSLYLVAVTFTERISDITLQNAFYLDMFLAHLGLGLLLAAPVLAFGALHFRHARRRPNRYAIRAGIGLYLSLVLLFGSGILLTRFGFFEVNDPAVRGISYWVHVLSPLAAVWLFLLHRLAGPPLRWQGGAVFAAVAAAVSVIAVGVHLELGGTGAPPVRALEPTLAKVSGNAPIPTERLMGDAVCAECHADIAERHAGSMHRFSSFNNPAYRKTVEDARDQLLGRDGNLDAARLCAVCHDPVPLFSGRFDDPDYDPEQDIGAEAGISCLSCHAISAVNGTRGNGDYTLTDPPRYPFAFSENPVLQSLNRQLIKAKPAFHKRTLLKPLHGSAEFCSGCHKVHLPPELNHYRWLRGQNHYDSFRLSGISGHRVDSFYYPNQAKTNCASCHMPARPSTDPAARPLEEAAARAVHDHRFAAANTAVAEMVGRPAEENAERVAMMQRAARVDLFGLKRGGRIDGKLIAPLRPTLPVLTPGEAYLLEVVVRTDGIGHALTQGTADSNEVWLDLRAQLSTLDGDGKHLIGQSGALDAAGNVDAWAWFGNAYLLNRDGERITRRNAQDIHVALYDHQIPPGAASVVHYRVEIPANATGTLEIAAALHYRKFDSRFYRYLLGDAYERNDLPITTLANDRIRLTVADTDASSSSHDPAVPLQSETPLAWQRWNDYGIGLLREGKRGETRQAEAAFHQVEALGGAPGALNLARVLYREGRLEEAADALERAKSRPQPHGEAPPWTIAWYTALIARDLGDLDRAIEALEALTETRFVEARARGFDFSIDDRMLVELGRTLYERARRERGPERRVRRIEFLRRARSQLDQALRLDPESAAAHHNLSLVLAELDEPVLAEHHRREHERYRRDDNAVERAVSIHRSRNPAADHAAEPVAIYTLGADTPASTQPHHTAARQIAQPGTQNTP